MISVLNLLKRCKFILFFRYKDINEGLHWLGKLSYCSFYHRVQRRCVCH